MSFREAAVPRAALAILLGTIAPATLYAQVEFDPEAGRVIGRAVAAGIVLSTFAYNS